MVTSLLSICYVWCSQQILEQIMHIFAHFENLVATTYEKFSAIRLQKPVSQNHNLLFVGHLNQEL